MSRTLVVVVATLALAQVAAGQQEQIPKDIAGSVAQTLDYVEAQFVTAAEAMPEAKYGFVPTAGEFKGVRSFAEQVKHVACANEAFFNQIEGKKPPEHCEKGGPNPAKTKAELLKYLRDSFAYGKRVLPSINGPSALERVEGPYAGPSTRLGMAVTAVWHVTDHYGQMVEYLRMNGIGPPATQQEGLPVR